VLLRIEHRHNPKASTALWIPTLWLLLCGSKPIARWFQFGGGVLEADETGSPLDRFVLITLISVSCYILSKRKIRWSRILQDNVWLIMLYLYLGFSVVWSDFPDVSLKRWIRLCGMIPIALVVLTEENALRGLESILRRCAYVLIPLSLTLIKYFPDLGVAYVSWSGEKMWVGVTSQKNGLGTLCAISAFFIIWSLYRDWRAGSLRKNKSRIYGDGLILLTAVFLLQGFKGAYSGTSIGMLLVGAAMLLLLSQCKKFIKPVSWFATLGLALVLVSLQVNESFRSTITSAFNRDSTFTGRTDIWDAVLKVCSQSEILGTGYGGFWELADEAIWETLRVHEAHSGYLEVYLGGGIVGIVFFSAFLLAHYRKAVREFQFAYDWGLFAVASFMMVLIGNFTESVFIRTSSFFWNITVFLSIVLTEPILRNSRKKSIIPVPQPKPANRSFAVASVDDSRSYGIER
jgi:O-antigen ligase